MKNNLSLIRDRRAAAFSSFVVAVLLFSGVARAQQLTWDANADDDSVSAYKIYYGHAPADRQFVVNVGNVTSFRFLPAFTSNTYFVVTAVNAVGESGASNEVAYITTPADTVAENICDCDGDGAPRYTLDYAKLRRLIGQNKFKQDGTLNPNYVASYDLNKDEKINGVDRAIHKARCK